MIDRLKNLVRDESGITALETAIILIAFVVVASVFAFTILSAGTFSTERGRQAIYAGLEQVSNSMEVYGSVIGSLTNSTDTTVDQIEFTLAVVAGGEGVNMAASADSDNTVVISYLDDDEYVEELTWTTSWTVRGDVDDLLEQSELVKITIDGLVAQGGTLGAAEEFRLEVKPPQGGVLPVIRTTPASLDSYMAID